MTKNVSTKLGGTTAYKKTKNMRPAFSIILPTNRALEIYERLDKLAKEYDMSRNAFVVKQLIDIIDVLDPPTE